MHKLERLGMPFSTKTTLEVTQINFCGEEKGQMDTSQAWMSWTNVRSGSASLLPSEYWNNEIGVRVWDKLFCIRDQFLLSCRVRRCSMGVWEEGPQFAQRRPRNFNDLYIERLLFYSWVKLILGAHFFLWHHDLSTNRKTKFEKHDFKL